MFAATLEGSAFDGAKEDHQGDQDYSNWPGQAGQLWTMDLL